MVLKKGYLPFSKLCKWALCANPLEYLHSSARFYLTGEQGIYPVTTFFEMKDVSFNEGTVGVRLQRPRPALQAQGETFLRRGAGFRLSLH